MSEKILLLNLKINASNAKMRQNYKKDRENRFLMNIKKDKRSKL
jgi:hypothetical protein